MPILGPRWWSSVPSDPNFPAPNLRTATVNRRQSPFSFHFIRAAILPILTMQRGWLLIDLRPLSPFVFLLPGPCPCHRSISRFLPSSP